MNEFFCAILILLSTEQAQKDPPADDKKNSLKRIIEDTKISGQFRTRYEYRDVTSYSTTALLEENDDLLLFRSRLGFDIPVEENVNFFFQLQDSRTAGQESSVASNDKNIDALQVYADIKKIGDLPLSARIGRQKFVYGNQRVLSDLDWNNVSRAWNGIKLRYDLSDKWWVDGFYSVIKEGTGQEDDQDFYGAYSSYKICKGLTHDLYILGRRFADNSFAGENGSIGDKKDLTFGTLCSGNAIYDNGDFSLLNYSAEFAAQKGEQVDDDIKSFGLALNVGYRVGMFGRDYAAEFCKINLEYTFASGDSNPTDGDIETFDPPFPFAHAYQGYADIFAWKNGHDYALKLEPIPTDGFKTYIDFHIFRLADSEDAWYDASGAVVRRDKSGNSGRDIGRQLDIHFKVKLTEKMGLWFGWSHFFAGNFVENTTGSGRNLDWFFCQLSISF